MKVKFLDRQLVSEIGMEIDSLGIGIRIYTRQNRKCELLIVQKPLIKYNNILYTEAYVGGGGGEWLFCG